MQDYHVALIGGLGNVGRAALSHFVQNFPTGDRIRITAVSRKPNAFNLGVSMRQEVEEAASINLPDAPFRTIDFRATHQYDDISRADLVVILAGTKPTPELRQQLQEHHIDPRTIHAFANLDLIHSVCQDVQLVAPDANVIVVTNQSDLMSRVTREYFPQDNVLGYGGMSDTYRLQLLLKNHIEGRSNIDVAAAKEAIKKCGVIGHHDDSFILCPSNPEIPGVSPQQLEHFLKRTRTRGHNIAMLGSDDEGNPQPPSALAGNGISMTIAARSGRGAPITAAFNTCINQPWSDKCRGLIAAGKDLSVPIQIDKNGISFPDPGEISDADARLLSESVKRMDRTYEQLLSFNNKKLAVPHVAA